MGEEKCCEACFEGMIWFKIGEFWDFIPMELCTHQKQHVLM